MHNGDCEQSQVLVMCSHKKKNDRLYFNSPNWPLSSILFADEQNLDNHF